MAKHRIGLTVLQRYWLFQAPGIAVVGSLLAIGAHWFSVPLWACLLAFALWVTKDLLLYPFLKTAYEGSGPSGLAALVGAVGVAQERLAPSGIVKIGPELWRAESTVPIEAGQPVRVTACQGMTLLVESVPAPRPDSNRERKDGEEDSSARSEPNRTVR